MSRANLASASTFHSSDTSSARNKRNPSKPSKGSRTASLSTRLLQIWAKIKPDRVAH